MLVDAVRTYRYGDGYPVPESCLFHRSISPQTSPTARSSASTIPAMKKPRACAVVPAVAERTHAAFFDASAVAIPSTTDRLHMDAQSHRNLALALLPLVRTLLGN